MDFDDMNVRPSFYSSVIERHIRPPGKAENRQLLELNVKAKLERRSLPAISRMVRHGLHAPVRSLKGRLNTGVVIP
jgi:hypothetical protein